MPQNQNQSQTQVPVLNKPQARAQGQGHQQAQAQAQAQAVGSNSTAAAGAPTQLSVQQQLQNAAGVQQQQVAVPQFGYGQHAANAGYVMRGGQEGQVAGMQGGSTGLTPTQDYSRTDAGSWFNQFPYGYGQAQQQNQWSAQRYS